MNDGGLWVRTMSAGSRTRKLIQRAMAFNPLWRTDLSTGTPFSKYFVCGGSVCLMLSLGPGCMVISDPLYTRALTSFSLLYDFLFFFFKFV